MHSYCVLVTFLSEEEKQSILSDTGFQNAFKRIGCIVENVVAKNVDITRDYVTAVDDGEGKGKMARAHISLNRLFYDNKWSNNRCITGLDWSNHYPDWLVASYYSNEVCMNVKSTS